jgi:hypothetical protein
LASPQKCWDGLRRRGDSSPYEKTEKTFSKRVVEAYVRDGVSTLALTLSTGEVITTTREHPFYVDGRGFVPAGRLAIGTAIVTYAGPAVRITGIRQGERARVYNFQVADTHTYFVGASGGGVWVHDADECPGDDILDTGLPCAGNPEATLHIEDAIAAGKPDVLTWDPEGAVARRSDSLRGHDPVPGKDRDGYPPATTREGGDGASVGSIGPSEHRQAGARLGGRARKLKPGSRFRTHTR